MKKKYEIILKSGSKNNYLFTIAIGQKYLKAWKTYSLNNWVHYCKKNSLGLIVITDHLISKKNKYLRESVLLGCAIPTASNAILKVAKINENSKILILGMG